MWPGVCATQENTPSARGAGGTARAHEQEEEEPLWRTQSVSSAVRRTRGGSREWRDEHRSLSLTLRKTSPSPFRRSPGLVSCPMLGSLGLREEARPGSGPDQGTAPSADQNDTTGSVSEGPWESAFLPGHRKGRGQKLAAPGSPRLLASDALPVGWGCRGISGTRREG